jgi:hypothetical protein
VVSATRPETGKIAIPGAFTGHSGDFRRAYADRRRPIMFVDTLMVRLLAKHPSGKSRRREPKRRPLSPAGFNLPHDFRGGRGRGFRDILSRRLCWAFAASGTALFKISARLSRSGIVTPRQALQLMRWSSRLHRIAIRLLRRGCW